MDRIQSSLVALLLSIACSPRAAAQEPVDGAAPQSAANAVAAVIDAARPVLARRSVPGLAVAAVARGESATGVLGVRDVDGRPVTPDSRFYVASCTKTCTALLLAKLAAADAFELDDPVQSVLPQVALADPAAAAAMTLRDLLCHRPGLNSRPAVFLDAFTGEITDARYFALLALERPAGQCTYSNVHMTLAARAAEAVVGAPWQELLERELFLPAGMTRTTARASVAYGDADCAWPLLRAGAGWRRQRVKSDRTMHAAGGLCTTAADAARWLALFLDRGVVGAERVVAAEAVEETLALEEPQRGVAAEFAGSTMHGFGLAWWLGEWRGRRFAIHGGDYLGYAACFVLLPDDAIGVVVMANDAAARVALATAEDLLARLAGDKGTNSLGFLATLAPSAPLPAAAAPPAAGAPELGAPPATFVGRFAHPLLGTLVLELEAGRLVGRLGELRGPVFPEADPAAAAAGELQIRVEGDDLTVDLLPERDAAGTITAWTVGVPGGAWRFEPQR